jgi:peptidylprolyl isomerase domain and WD repeat-containing protein 1
MLEYWEPEEPFDLPKNVNFEYKAETDLYDFKKVDADIMYIWFI